MVATAAHSLDMLSDEDLQQRREAMGRRLVEARESRSFDQQELARLSGVSRVMISDFERATRTMSLEHFHRLCDGLSIRPAWLLGEDAEMWADGATLGQVRDEAARYRHLEVDFVSAVNAMLRRYRQDKKRRVWALGACLRAYWGAHWLGFNDLQEVAQIVEIACDRCGLDPVEVLESTGHANASQYTADWLMHRGIDPEAFGPVVQPDGLSYEVFYHRGSARSPEQLAALAQEKARTTAEPSKSKVGAVLDYLLGFVRFFDREAPKP